MQDISLFIQHHPALCFALLLVAILAACVEYVRLRQQAAEISPAAAVTLMNRENATVLDIRNKEAFLTGHITGAVSLPADELLKDSKKADKFRTHPVIVTCGNGHEAVKIAAALQKQGFDSRILAGGMQAWLAAGLPIIRK